MQDFKDNFIEHAKKYGEAIEEGNHKLANKLHSKLTVLYQKIQNERKWEVLYELINHPNESVQLWSATFLLKNDNEIALDVLNKLKQSEKIVGLTATSIIDMWNKGMLQL
ncbi:MAG: hypothetical protein PHT07_12965 [Paludibacter sp.]|nr:hypothetical protein [Paludibacter sp.]